MDKVQLIAAIKASGKVENAEAAMHADAILGGAYTLAELLAEADSFYGYDGYAQEALLADSI